MHADHVYQMGSGHRVCEDYATSGSFGPNAYAIVCDGSSSGKNVDVGARVYAHCAEQHLPFLMFHPGIDAYAMASFRDRVNTSVRTTMSVMSPIGILNSKSLLSTLLVCFTVENRWHVIAMGDGAYFIRHTDDTLSGRFLKASENAPYYPSYAFDLENERRMIEEYGGKVTLEWSDVEPVVVPDAKFLHFSGSLDNVKAIGIATDGLETFFDETTEHNRYGVIDEMSRFKNYQPGFLQRRVQAAMKTYARDGVRHFDDIGIGAISTQVAA